MYEIDDEEFWKIYETKSYLDIFYIRNKVWRSLIPARPPIGSRNEMMQKENHFPNNKNMLYFNIPFCASRCSFCLYYTKIYERELVDRYLDALEKEVEAISNTKYVKSTRFECVYFGGGTPSLLNEKQIDRVANIVFKNFQVTDELEISFEANPSSLSLDKVMALKRNNFNRISLGIQSFNDKYLKQMNCRHNSKEAKEVINMLLEKGFNVNIDLIYGFQGQTEEELQMDLEEILNFKNLHHISIFPLRLVTQTPLYNKLEKQQELNIQAHQNKIVKYHECIDSFFKNNSYISEEESVHYYKRGFHPHRYQSLDGRIIGFGSGAGTLLDNVESGNKFDVNDYIEAINSKNSAAFADSVITDEQMYERYILYRLLYMNRSLPDLKGIIEKRFSEFYGIDIGDRYEKVIGHLLAKKLIVLDGQRVIFTDKFLNILKNFRFGTPSVI
ncbi:coproporphyrinogen-III oxidase family protein [Ruminiclostridium cellulolyticum]|uniref:Heme chaperone HemW n=1 Tax=Ruminiclostridium cellulolyticum (strain ATCC 35319 / DSM 5812 / JCM 6584 / H10) TaxID=394503 RepID=B8I8L2_RUMCH|nr:coproporphyrinogen-III oxidase family protein [Ruminiclostridium cellulolyticum]ACL75245.1 Radical SAM domain protein [Ruminiclostridium cellulolyticum H10]